MHLDKDQVKRVFGLSISQIAVIMLFGLGILTVINFSVITLHFTQGTILSKSDVQASFASQLQAWFSAPILNMITLVVFWVAVGLLAYAVLYWVYNIITEARNEVVVEQEYTNRASLEERKKWPIIEIGLLAGLVVLAILTLTMFFPIWNSLFIGAIYDVPSNWLGAALGFVGSVVGMFVTIYAFKALIGLMLILE